MIGGDYIFVRNLLARTVVGRDAWQRQLAQPLKISLAVGLGSRLRRMALTDDLRRTLNYDSLSTDILSQVESQQFESSEHLGKFVQEIINKRLSRGEWADVHVAQPKARLLAKSYEVTLKNNKVTEKLQGLNFPTIIGVNDLERVYKQVVETDVLVERQPNKEIFSHEFVDKLANHIADSSFLTIESFANKLADIVIREPGVKRAVVRAAKPSALNMADLAQIQVERCAPIVPDDAVYIAFGTNTGDCKTHIMECIPELEKRGVHVLQTSAIYETEPMYHEDQAKFYNGVFRCETDLAPRELLHALKEIEYGIFGRVKKFDNGPRTMDLDILIYGQEMIDLPELKIPHIDMLNRPFVLTPLKDVTPFPIAEFKGTERMVVPLYGAGFLTLDHTLVMSIMNATPDSFSDGGNLLSNDVHEVARQHLLNGAEILDIGGQSTRPGAEWHGTEQEADRVCKVIREIRAHDDTRHAVISVDTCFADVAEAALSAGANILNDVYSGVLDPRMFAVAARTGAPIILSHARGDPKTMSQMTDYPNGLIDGVAVELRERIDAALQAGCRAWQLILDPGLGFAKTEEQNLALIRDFEKLKHHKALTEGLPMLPWLVGPSRKGFIGKITGEKVAANRVNGTVASVVAVCERGAEMVRVHDTKAVSQAVKFVDALRALK